MCNCICTNVSYKIEKQTVKFKTRLIALFLVICFQAYSQSNTDNKSSSKLELIESIKGYCINELNMDVSKHFYSNWAKSEKPNYYLYVSEKDTLISPFNQQKSFISFGHNFEKAKKEKDYYDELGYSTLLYETYGTSGTQLSNHLLSYSEENIAFIAFHEATHQHIRNKAKIPYSIVESVCDIVGNYGTLNLFSENEKFSTRKAKKQIKHIENIALEINNLIDNIELKSDKSKLTKKIQKLNKKKNRFKIERYDYEINNAYLIRYKSYTKYYFKLKNLLILTGDLEVFMDFITDLPKNESDCILEIDKKIKILEKIQ